MIDYIKCYNHIVSYSNNDNPLSYICDCAILRRFICEIPTEKHSLLQEKYNLIFKKLGQIFLPHIKKFNELEYKQYLLNTYIYGQNQDIVLNDVNCELDKTCNTLKDILLCIFKSRLLSNQFNVFNDNFNDGIKKYTDFNWDNSQPDQMLDLLIYLEKENLIYRTPNDSYDEIMHNISNNLIKFVDICKKLCSIIDTYLQFFSFNSKKLNEKIIFLTTTINIEHSNGSVICDEYNNSFFGIYPCLKKDFDDANKINCRLLDNELKKLFV